MRMDLKTRPCQQQCRSNILECYESSNSFDEVVRCFDIVAVFWQQCRTKFRPFDKFEKKIEQKNGNNVESKFDFVERTDFCDKSVRHCCRFLATKSKCFFHKVEYCFDIVADVYGALKMNCQCDIRNLHHTGRCWWRSPLSLTRNTMADRHKLSAVWHLRLWEEDFSIRRKMRFLPTPLAFGAFIGDEPSRSLASKKTRVPDFLWWSFVWSCAQQFW